MVEVMIMGITGMVMIRKKIKRKKTIELTKKNMVKKVKTTY